MAEREPEGAAADLWMAWAFGLGSACFLVGPLPWFAALVGARLDALTFFVGSILFTVGGAVQTWVAAQSRGDRRHRDAGRAAFWAAAVQSAGTLFFNVTTFRGLQVTLENPAYDKLVWRPDAFGSICFLVSGLIAYRSSARRGWRPLRTGTGWWQPAVNLLGCVFFAVAAVGGYVLREHVRGRPGGREPHHVCRGGLLPVLRDRHRTGGSESPARAGVIHRRHHSGSAGR